MLNLFPTSTRFDQSTVELLLWYEAIFGKEMWKHVIVETTFWSHSSEAAALRYRNFPTFQAWLTCSTHIDKFANLP